MSLFRDEVHEQKKFRLHGDIDLSHVKSSSALIALVTVIVGVALILLFAGRYSRTEEAFGRIVPEGSLIRVMPPRQGIVTKLQAREGDVVAKGQELATVTVEQASSALSDPSSETLKAIDNQIDVVRQQETLLSQLYDQNRAKSQSNLNDLQKEQGTIADEIRLQEKVVESTRQSFEPLQEVMQQGYISRSQYELKKQAYLSALEQLAQLRATLSQTEAHSRQAFIDERELAIDERTKVGDLQSSISALLQKRIEAEVGRSYVVVAPVSGRITALQVAVGTAVASQVPLMVIVNSSSGMMGEVYGAVPTLAIIDTGHPIYWPDGGCGSRRAIIVRENIIRVASLQRSIFFGCSGSIGSDQELDERRVAESWENVWACHEPLGSNPASVLNSCFSRVGVQYGFGDATRLWPGPLSSQNIGIDGRLLDFGNSRAVPDWRKALGADSKFCFGDYRNSVRAMAESLARLASKYGKALSADVVASHFEHGFAKGFELACDRCHIPRGQGFRRALRKAFAAQQTRIGRIASESRLAWPSNVESLMGERHMSTEFASLKILVQRAAESVTGDWPATKASLDRFLGDTPELARERLAAEIENFLGGVHQLSQDSIDSFISSKINHVVHRFGRSHEHPQNSLT